MPNPVHALATIERLHAAVIHARVALANNGYEAEGPLAFLVIREAFERITDAVAALNSHVLLVAYLTGQITVTATPDCPNPQL